MIPPEIQLGAGAVLGALITATGAARWYVRPITQPGRHRAPRALPVPVIEQAFRFCLPCGVETAAVLHRDGSHTCTEDHTTAQGDPT
ncbi:hypothetical protein ABZT03_40810 [Streptomyces sp. NPDC005574]|uniref:hypothetical protein n=1 Tax=Streptomyces sp. NPDC005574 TaxID=3156891 RepID=UPI0033B30C03